MYFCLRHPSGYWLDQRLKKCQQKHTIESPLLCMIESRLSPFWGICDCMEAPNLNTSSRPDEMSPFSQRRWSPLLHPTMVAPNGWPSGPQRFWEGDAVNASIEFIGNIHSRQHGRKRTAWSNLCMPKRCHISQQKHACWNCHAKKKCNCCALWGS